MTLFLNDTVGEMELIVAIPEKDVKEMEWPYDLRQPNLVYEVVLFLYSFFMKSNFSYMHDLTQ